MIKLWAARDLNGDLYFYRNKPMRGHGQWIIDPVTDPKDSDCEYVREKIFKDIRWDDDEPTKISLNDLIIECRKYYNDLARKLLGL